jgi:hypothetical protein
MTGHAQLREGFLALSATLSGFSAFRLTGTGQVDSHLAAVTSIVGTGVMADLIAAYRAAERSAGGDAAAMERALRRLILSDARLGPVARNIIKLWFVGTWYQLPADWREAHGSAPQDHDFVVSPTAYTEGLLWPAIGANPAGAKPLGYGIWATQPRIPQD